MDDSVLSVALAGVHGDESVSGACVEAEGKAVANHLPFSESKARRLCATVHEMCAGYSSVGRAITEYCFSYDKASVLVFAEHNARLILLATPKADLDSLCSTGRRFVQEHGSLLESLSPKPRQKVAELKLLDPPPAKANGAKKADAVIPFAEPPPPSPVVGTSRAGSKAEAWLVFREKLHVLLNRVMASAQSTRLVDRVIAEYGFSQDRAPDRGCFRNIAEDLVDHIQNRSRRRSLQASLDELLRLEKL